MRSPLLALLLCAAPLGAADFPRPAPAKADEPLAKRFSLAKAGEYLDGVGVNWTRDRDCITCHTNMPYLTARPLLKGDAGWKEVRKYLEDQVKSWPDADEPPGTAAVVATAFALSFNDAQQTGTLHPATRTALDRMFDPRRKSSEWAWIKCEWPPLEHDDYYGATLAALAIGYAPGDYAKTDTARRGIKHLALYFKKTPPPDLHHAAMLLWASTKLDGLLTAEEQKKTIAALKAKQRKDGGWALPSLGAYVRRDKERTPNDPDADSDGYGTGFVAYVLLQAGAKPGDAEIVSAVKWLKANQRESGRWFTRSLNTDRAHYISNAGTAFAVLALLAAGEK